MELIFGFLGVTWLAIFWIYKREEASTKALAHVINDVDQIWDIADETHYGVGPDDGVLRDYRNLRERVEDIEESMIAIMNEEQRERFIQIILERNENGSRRVVGEDWLREQWLVQRP